MAEDKVTARGRELGAELRRRRLRAGYTGQVLSERLGWSATQISRVENGIRLISDTDVAIYLASCGVPRDEMDPILELAREARSDHRFKWHGEKLPDELTTLIFQETTARAIDSFESILVPGLLQTEDYATALFKLGSHFPRDSVRLRVRARIDRQALLRRSEPPWCTFYIHENGLRMPVGDVQTMHDQLEHLAFLATWKRIQIRVVPVAAGPRGLAYSSFRVMRYAEHDPVAYVEQEIASVFLDQPEHTGHFRQVLNRLDRAALDAGQSKKFLAELAEGGPDA